ncbi:helix-turn-helix domain-containing protein [Limosilactobacillus fermentum]|uniref:AlbA family DNA-binding domain-containing protein n=1 Tax=Limosilactobacillus fermentum TaxID=1613 RepID=UPI000FECB856|nr:ATP-binding protein [Limosilactobacillus fermentum]QAR21467.1 ATP-binding protein [Limosilactobacillus fermentum]
MNEEDLFKLIETREDDRHDFKEKWYSSDVNNSKKAEMLKDIFSFVNTTHDEDCYLIFGVTDDTREIVGIENDENRYNTQQITDWLSSLPIEPEAPRVRVETISVKSHEVDVMIIRNTDRVPVFLRSGKKGKGFGNHPIGPGQVFTRKEDTNTSISGTADYNQLTKLFKKHLGLNLPIEKRFEKVLQDWKNWNYYEHSDGVGIQYSLDPDFKVVFVDRDADAKAESFSLSQVRVDVSWGIAQLKHRTDIIKEIGIVDLDGARFKAVVPDIGSISNSYGKNLFYDCYKVDSLKFKLEELINNMESVISPDYGSLNDFMESIVLYKDNEHQSEVEQYLSNIANVVNTSVEPDSEMISIYKNKLETDVPRGSVELSDLAIEQMAKRIKLGKCIKKFMGHYSQTL